MRPARRLIAPLIALTATVVATLAASPASAGDYDNYVYPDAVVAWPVGPVTAGTLVTAVVTSTGLVRDTVVTLIEQTDEAEVPLGTVVVGPTNPVVSIPLPTDKQGTRDLMLEADDYNDDIDDYVGLYLSEDYDLVVVGVPSTVQARYAPPVTVRPGFNAPAITGEVTGGARPVQVQASQRPGVWTTVKEATSQTDGSFSVATPSTWIGKQSLRVFAPAFGPHAEVVSEQTGAVDVSRPYRLKGSSKNAPLIAGYRWNPCRVLTYRLNPSMMPKSGPATVRYALAQVSMETGLRFAYAGTTQHNGFVRRSPAREANTDFVIAWSTARRTGILAGGTLGLGGSSGSGNGAYSDGRVIIDAQDQRRLSIAAQRTVMLHELGHAVGLGHVNDRRLVMNPSLARPLVRYGKGDVISLGKVGAAGGCVDESGYSGPYGRTTAPVTAVLP